MTNPYCPKCQGRGWYKGPYYGDFELKIVKLACGDCLPHSRPSKLELVALGLGFIILFTLLIVGAP